MKDFASELAKVSFSDGLKVKQTTPLKNLRKFCQGLMGDESIDSLKSIKALQKQLCGIATKIASERNDVRNLCKSVSGKIHSTLRTEIKKLADKHAETMNDTAFKDECMAEFSKNCKRYNIEIGEKFIHNFDGFHMKSLSAIPKFNNFSQHFEEKKFASKKSEKIGQAIGTGLGGIGAGALMGAEIGSIIPGAGTLIGGLIGAGIGAIFGGKVGKSIGENFNETETVKTHVGDNREDVANGVIEVLIESSNLYMNDVYTQLDNICFRDLEVWMEQLQSLLDDFYRTLENQINVINKELNYGAA